MLPPIVRKMAGTLAQPYLNQPAPESLEFLATTGERETVTVEDQLYFIYELLTSSGARYQKKKSPFSPFSIDENIGIPLLPTNITGIKPTFKSRLRDILRPEERLPTSYDGIEQALQSAIENAKIIQWTEGVYGIFGSTESEIRRLLYVPAGTPKEADVTMNAYRQEVTEILQPKRLVCNLKIKPLTKPGNLQMVPTTLKHSYFGHGC